MTGIELIAAERERQVNEEGWTPEHDDTHQLGELAQAAACYANPKLPPFRSNLNDDAPEGWPWDASWWKPSVDYRNEYVRNSNLHGHVQKRVRDLVKAGALIAAEIDRLQRLSDAGTQQLKEGNRKP